MTRAGKRVERDVCVRVCVFCAAMAAVVLVSCVPAGCVGVPCSLPGLGGTPVGWKQVELPGLMRQQLQFISVAPSNQSMVRRTYAAQAVQQGPPFVVSSINTSVFS